MGKIKILDLVWRLRKVCNFCVAGATEILNPELNVKRVDTVSITTVVILKLKWRRAGNGSVISVHRREFARGEIAEFFTSN